MALLRLRLPLQEGLLQLEHGQGREVQLLLPADRGRAADRLLGDLRRAAPPPRDRARSTPTASRRPPRSPTSTTCSRPSSTSSSTRRIPRCASRPRRDGIADDWIEAARRSPVYAMCKRWRIALPLHPEYRTMPMVWYVPPLSPVESMVEPTRRRARPRARCSRPSTRCGSRSSTWPGSWPPATRSRCGARWRDWRRCAATCGRPTSTAESTPRSPTTSAWSRPRSRRCSRWSRSATTTTAT